MYVHPLIELFRPELFFAQPGNIFFHRRKGQGFDIGFLPVHRCHLSSPFPESEACFSKAPTKASDWDFPVSFACPRQNTA